jgi:pyruvate dehydrogenase E2 component (dihydrolipoamide acetyltransferase)
MTSGTIIEWLKNEGDEVEKGEVLFVVENDKSTVDVEAVDNGILSKIVVPENQKVDVGAIVAWLTAPGEDIPEGDTEATEKTAPAEEKQPAPSDTGPFKEQEEIVYEKAVRTAEEKIAMSPIEDGFVPASPRARSLAEENGIDLASLKGSGPEGSIIERDIIDRAGKDTFTETVEVEEDTEIKPLSRVQVIGARKMIQSWTSIPQFTLQRKSDVTQLKELYAYLKKTSLPNISFNLLLVKIISKAVLQYPLLNSRLVDEETVEVFRKINMGIAMDSDRGLVVPVIKDITGKDLDVISEEWKRKTAWISSGKDTPDDFSDATITVSNLGMFGISSFRAIVVPPQVAILSIGAASPKAVMSTSGEICFKTLMELGITADHRVVDGAYAARFLETVSQLIETPAAAFIPSR